MNLSDLLEWISRNPGASFLGACFLLALAAMAVDFLVKLVRSVTGHYPPQHTVYTQCDSDDPCYCCREGSCDEGCRCYPEEEDEADGRTSAK